MKRSLLFTLLFTLAAQLLAAEEVAQTTRPKLQYLGSFDSGQAGVSIHKLFDPSDDVVCYVMTPDSVSRKEIANNKFLYESNSIGSISCVKIRVAVYPTAAPTRK